MFHLIPDLLSLDHWHVSAYRDEMANMTARYFRMSFNCITLYLTMDKLRETLANSRPGPAFSSAVRAPLGISFRAIWTGVAARGSLIMRRRRRLAPRWKEQGRIKDGTVNVAKGETWGRDRLAGATGWKLTMKNAWMIHDRWRKIIS